MISFRDLVSGFRQLGLEPNRPVIVHASLSSIGEVRGGAESVLGALLATSETIVVPTFTPRCEIIPEVGPEDNAIAYGSGGDANRLADFFTPQTPAHPMMGVIAETLRRHPQATRTHHPLLSFAGIHAEEILHAQTLDDPLAPIRLLADQFGWVLLIGVGHSVNTSVHYAEQLAGRKQFIRWGLTPQGVRQCAQYPGCSDGFDQAAPLLKEITHQVTIGSAVVQAVPLESMIEILSQHLKADPLALLCRRPDCERCAAVRRAAQTQTV